MIAASAPAAKALRMKGYRSSRSRSRWRSHDRRGAAAARWGQTSMGMEGRRLGLPDHHEAAAGGAHHLDGSAVEAAWLLGGEYRLGRAGQGLTADDVDHLVEIPEDRVHVVGDDHHGDAV